MEDVELDNKGNYNDYQKIIANYSGGLQWHMNV
jgi:hypothetical protein